MDFTVGWILAIAVLAMTVAARADEVSWPSGVEIANHINARDEGVSVSQILRMEMVDRRGKSRSRVTRSLRKYFGDEKRTVIFYLEPTNVKDTAFLTYDYPERDRDDDQWLYLPALRKVRRISATDRGDYFLGTDLTYEDVKKGTKVGIDEYSWKTIGDDVIDGHHCFVVEMLPVSENVARELGYGKVVSWVDSVIWIVRKAEFWDIKGNLLKTTRIRNIEKIQGIWTVHNISVENHKTGHTTELVFSDVDYAAEVSDDLFTERALRRGYH